MGFHFVDYQVELEVELDDDGNVVSILLNATDIRHALKKSQIAYLKSQAEDEWME